MDSNIFNDGVSMAAYRFPVCTSKPIHLEQRKVLGLYNQSNKGSPRQSVCETVRNWLTKEAPRYGWRSVTFTDNGGATLMP